MGLFVSIINVVVGLLKMAAIVMMMSLVVWWSTCSGSCGVVIGAFERSCVAPSSSLLRSMLVEPLLFCQFNTCSNIIVLYIAVAVLHCAFHKPRAGSPRGRCFNQSLLYNEFGVNGTSKLRVDISKSTQTRKTNGKMWYSENCHVTALEVNTRVLPMDLDTRVPVISQPASPHHDIDAWGLRFAPRWRSLRWQSSICSS